MLKKTLPLVILVLAMSLFGCSIQRKPAPTEPQQKLVPQESVVGFSQIEMEQAPDSVKKIASHMSKREMVTWAGADNQNYIIVNPESDDYMTVEKIIQRVPMQDFLWLEVLLLQKDRPKEHALTTPLIFKLDRTGQNIKGVGFEILDDDDDEDKDKLSERKATDQQSATPQGTAKPPAAPINPIPERKPVSPEVVPETKTPPEGQQQQQQQPTTQEQKPEQIKNEQRDQDQEIKTLP